MKHCLYKPSHPLLKKIVRHIAFQELDGTGNPNHWMTLFPNCTTNLCITLDTSLIFRRKGLVQNCISTSCTRPVTFSRSNTIEMINVQFEPFGFRMLIDSSMLEHKDHFANFDDFFSALTLERLYNQLIDNKSDFARIKILENFILDQIDCPETDERILFAVTEMAQNPLTKLDDLTHHLNLSPRRLRDLFSLHLGVSPKYYLRLSRFNQLTRDVSTREDLSLTEIAFANGYFDQSHFIKDFKEFGGLSPNRFRKLREKTADFYNFEG